MTLGLVTGALLLDWKPTIKLKYCAELLKYVNYCCKGCIVVHTCPMGWGQLSCLAAAFCVVFMLPTGSPIVLL